MKKTALFAFLFLLCLAPVIRAATPEEITLRPTGNKGEWKILNQGGLEVGTLRTMEEGAYSVQLTNGQYLGILFKNGAFQKQGRRPVISPDEARLFLDLWPAVQKLK